MASELLLLFALILVNGFFSLSEMAIVSSRKARLRHEAERGRKAYKLALETAERPPASSRRSRWRSPWSAP